MSARPPLNEPTASTPRGDADLQPHVDGISREVLSDENLVNEMITNLMIEQKLFDKSNPVSIFETKSRWDMAHRD